jgi:hypothetical protein
MNSSKILAITLLASVMLFATNAVVPGINNMITGIPVAHASQAGDEKECLSSSSALFFDTQSSLTASV